MTKNRSRGKFRNNPKKSKDKKSKYKKLNENRKRKNQMAMENLAMLPVNVNQIPSKQKFNNIKEKDNLENNMFKNKNVNNTNLNSNVGHNVKRVVSSKMYSSKNKNGKEETMVDILSGVTKNEKSRILRHFRITKDGKKRTSTVLAKSNGKKIRVLESVQDGDKESVRKYKVKNPEEFKNILTVQRDEIKGENMIRTMNLKKNKNTDPNNYHRNKSLSNKSLPNKSLLNTNTTYTKKSPLQFQKIKNAIQKSLKSIIKPRPINSKNKKKHHHGEKKHHHGEKKHHHGEKKHHHGEKKHHHGEKKGSKKKRNKNRGKKS